MRIPLVSLVALAALARPVWASGDAQHYPLFGLSERDTDARAREALRRVIKDCEASEMSRIGPSPAQIARCEKAEKKALALGPKVARAALVYLDSPAMEEEQQGIYRLYDLVARAGGLELVEPLIRGLERNEREGLAGARRYETQLIADALTALTYAEPKGTPAIQWRAFWSQHHDKSRAELWALRTDEARTQTKSADFTLALGAARFLAGQAHTRKEGLSALSALAARPELSPAERRQLRAIQRDLEKTPPDSDLEQRPAA
jgi:hypothetical protein